MPLATQTGGAEALLQHLLRNSGKEYKIVCLFFEEGPLVAEAIELGYETSIIKTTRLREARNYLRTVCAIREWALRENLSAVLSWMAKAQLYVGAATLHTNVKVLWFQHGIFQRSSLDLATTALPARMILCCSMTAKIAQDNLFPTRRTEVCYPGVNSPISLPMDEARRLLNLPAGSPVVGMIARWERWKGPQVFIQAAQILAKRHPSSTFFMLGGPHFLDPLFAEEVRALAEKSGLGQRLLLLGQRPASEVPLWLAASDIIIHPVTGIEPFGMAVAEAMCMGKVVIASDQGGPAEIIEHGVNGILVPPHDAAAIACSASKLIEDLMLRSQLSEAATRRGQMFSITRFVARFNYLINSAIHE